MTRKEDRARRKHVQEQIQKSREVLGEATVEKTPGRVAVPDRFIDARFAGQGARPGDGQYTAGRDRVVEQRRRRDGARPT